MKKSITPVISTRQSAGRNKVLRRKFEVLILTAALRQMAVGLLAIFSPLYVLQLITGMGKPLQAAILGVVLFILGIYFVKLLTLPLAENLAYKFGFKWIIILSILPFFLVISFLILSPKNPFFLILVSIFWGIETALFWFGYHGLFVKFGDEHRFGFQTGISQSLAILVAVVTPIVGSLIVISLGFWGLFLTAGLFSLLTALMIAFSPLIKPYHDARISRVFQLFKTHPRVTGAYLGWGGEAALYGAIWPIFLILILGDVLTYGGIISGSILLAVVVTYLVGKWVDKAKGRQIIGLGVFLGVFSWLARIIARSPLSIVGVDGIYRMTEQMLAIPMDVFSYKKALEGGTSQALYFREISLSVGAVLFLAIVGGMVLLNLPLWTTFILGLMGTLAPLLVVRKV